MKRVAVFCVIALILLVGCGQSADTKRVVEEKSEKEQIVFVNSEGAILSEEDLNPIDMSVEWSNIDDVMLKSLISEWGRDWQELRIYGVEDGLNNSTTVNEGEWVKLQKENEEGTPSTYYFRVVETIEDQETLELLIKNYKRNKGYYDIESPTDNIAYRAVRYECFYPTGFNFSGEQISDFAVDLDVKSVKDVWQTEDKDFIFNSGLLPIWYSNENVFPGDIVSGVVLYTVVDGYSNDYQYVVNTGYDPSEIYIRLVGENSES